MTNIAVVGCGYWGPNLVRTLQEIEGCELVLCCDLDPERLKEITDKFPEVPTTTNFDSVINSDIVDAVVLATPVRTHHKLGMQVLTHGKHLLVEKPLATTVVECEEMIAAAAQDKVVLMAGHLFYYHSAVIKIKEIIDSGELGEIRHIYSQRLNLGRFQTDVNAMWSLGPHDVSIAMLLLGASPIEVNAKGASYLNDGIEDMVFMDMKFPGGVTVNCHLSWLHPEKVRKLTVIGSKGMLVYDDVASEGIVKVYDTGADFVDELPNGMKRYTHRAGKVSIPEIDRSTQPLARECEHFVQCVNRGEVPLSDGVNGLEVVKVLEAAQQSLDNQRMVGTITTNLLAV